MISGGARILKFDFFLKINSKSAYNLLQLPLADAQIAQCRRPPPLPWPPAADRGEHHAAGILSLAIANRDVSGIDIFRPIEKVG